MHSAQWYVDNDIDIRLSRRVVSIDRSAEIVSLSDDAVVRYDTRLLATGSKPRLLHGPGSDHDGVLYLRTLPDLPRLI